ncbi:MAG TPA: GNAT family N-acetyltransferase [Chloroflexia bacterium]
MLTELVIEKPTQADTEPLVALLGSALHIPGEGMQELFAILGADDFRLSRVNGKIAAGLGYVRMGQWFGGASVPSVGITTVGVAPEHRGTGLGLSMMRAILEELYEEGMPLSSLYPATTTFYRRVGYERAGQRITYELPLDGIDVRERGLDLVPIEKEHYPEVYRLYEERARRSSGHLDRPEWLWNRKLEPKDQKPHRFIVARDGQPEGYVIFKSGERSEPISVFDACVLTPGAGRRVLTLLAGFATMVDKVTWSGGPLDSFIYLLNEPMSAGLTSKFKVTRSFDWMLRLVDVEKALTLRGYPNGLDAEVHLDVQDDLLPANNGRFTLAVSGGEGHVSPGGEGRIKLGVRELASIYTGFISPLELQSLGKIEGERGDLALAGAIFAGARPWMPDMF